MSEDDNDKDVEDDDDDGCVVVVVVWIEDGAKAFVCAAKSAVSPRTLRRIIL